MPAAVVPAVAVRVLTQRQWVGINRTWAAGIPQSRRSDYWAELTATASAGKEIRLFGLGEWIVERQQAFRLHHFEPVWRQGERAVRHQWVQFLLTTVSLITIYLLATRYAVQHDYSLGLLAASLAAAWGVFSAVAGNAEAFAIEGARPVIRAYEALKRELTIDASDSPSPEGNPSADGGSPPEIRFESVHFTYPRADRPILSDVNLTIHPGEVLAVVGLNGTGKTTLTKILAGLHEPTSGRVTANGVDIREIGLGAWRRQIAVVFQDFIKYQSSVKDNIVLGKALNMNNGSALAKSIDDANLSTLLASLPDGLSTPLSRAIEGGVDLSGGQWQQVALARAMFALHSGSTVLVLDEPTAHLDVRTEFTLFRQLTESARNASVVLISHRLSTVREADRIVVIDAGRIVESGSHDELMAADGKYASMFRIQASRFRTNETSVVGPSMDGDHE